MTQGDGSYRIGVAAGQGVPGDLERGQAPDVPLNQMLVWMEMRAGVKDDSTSSDLRRSTGLPCAVSGQACAQQAGRHDLGPNLGRCVGAEG